MAMAEAAAAIRAGEADRMVAVGHDAPIEPERCYIMLGLVCCRATRFVRSMHIGKHGLWRRRGRADVGSESEARARQGNILGEFLGSGLHDGSNRDTRPSPDGDGLSRAIQAGLADAGISPDAVGMIVAHGNGTRASDSSEAMAIRRVWGEKPPPVTAFKWAFGHTLPPQAHWI